MSNWLERENRRLEKENERLRSLLFSTKEDKTLQVSSYYYDKWKEAEKLIDQQNTHKRTVEISELISESQYNEIVSTGTKVIFVDCASKGTFTVHTVNSCKDAVYDMLLENNPEDILTSYRIHQNVDSDGVRRIIITDETALDKKRKGEA